MSVDKLVGRNNKVHFIPLMTHIINTDMETFVTDFRRPFIIGQDLMQGDLVAKSGMIQNKTFRFKANESDGGSDAPSAISKAFYYIGKSEGSNEESGSIFTIGRTAENDITINDYAVSKTHAKVHYHKGSYYIVDAGSTNGVTIDELDVPSDKAKRLNPGCTLGFGRLRFQFLFPIALYCRVLALLQMGNPKKEKLIPIAITQPREQLVAMLKSQGVKVEATTSKEAILRFMNAKFSDSQLLSALSSVPIL
jgi:hypothetical protein